MRRGALLAVAGVLVASCASGSGGGPVTPIRADNVFVSPSGEPFHGDPSGPYASALWFAQADMDHDGRLSRAEFMADALRAFHRYDANGDGVIDGLEIAAYEDRIAPEIQPRVGALHAGEGMDSSLFGGRGPGPAGGGREQSRSRRTSAADLQLQGAGFYSFLSEPEPISSADADLDGKVTLAEWRSKTDKRFDALADGAAELTLDRLPKPAMQRLLERQRARQAERPRP